MEFTRYAIYYTPPADAPWARFATSWLGWDLQTGKGAAHPPLNGLSLDEITQTPRKYGLHGTIKPPFRLAKGVKFSDLETACARLCRDLSPISLGPLHLTRLGRFLALCPEQSDALSTLAGNCVRDLDAFRAPLSDTELEARSVNHLTPRQEANLTKWGYPHVMDQFRFHITLTGRLQKLTLNAAKSILEDKLMPLLPEDLTVSDLTLAGEGPQGRFYLIRRFELLGS